MTACTEPAVRRGGLRFLVHFTAMVALMYVGMLAFDPLYGWMGVRLGTRNPGTDWPVVSALVMVAEMTIPMVPFMRWHGHDRRHIVEMAGAMAIPTIVAVILYLVGAVQAHAVAGIGHVAMVPAMLGAMLYRRGDYTMSGRGRPRHRTRPGRA